MTHTRPYFKNVMLERLRDKVPLVRAQAARALSRLQVTEALISSTLNDEHPIIKPEPYTPTPSSKLGTLYPIPYTLHPTPYTL
jgi:hypothetical protein